MNTKVQRTKILTTNFEIFSAWEPSTIAGEHRTITFFDGKCFGQIGSNPDPKIYNHLPVGEERFQAVRTAYEQQYNRAYDLIYEQFPELLNIDHKKESGEIVICRK